MKNIVIIGGGAGGLELAVGLSKKYRNGQYKVTLIDKEKTHIWKPHLHEVAAGSLDAHQEQVDYLNLANKFQFDFIWGEMDSMNRVNKQIFLKAKHNREDEIILPQRTVSYDYLVIGVGSTSNDFGTAGVKDFAFSLDNLESANSFHECLLEKVLQKEYSADTDNFRISIIGGGATGVELAAELSQTIAKLSHFGLNKLNKNPVKITVVNAADQLLPGLSEKISLGAKAILEDANVNILNKSKVVSIEKGIANIEQNGTTFSLISDLIVWAAGVKSSDFLAKLDGLQVNRGNQLIVKENLQTEDPYIFAIGDCASLKWIDAPKEGLMVPPRAQAAHQMSSYLIKYIDKIAKGETVPPFVYKDWGSLISLGSGETVGTLMGFLKGKHLFIEGKVAKMFYINLYNHHQVQINGLFPAMFMLVGKLIQKAFKPKVKLH